MNRNNDTKWNETLSPAVDLSCQVQWAASGGMLELAPSEQATQVCNKDATCPCAGTVSGRACSRWHLARKPKLLSLYLLQWPGEGHDGPWTWIRKEKGSEMNDKQGVCFYPLTTTHRQKKSINFFFFIISFCHIIVFK